MYSAVATVLCITIIGCLLWRDTRREDSPSAAVWIPLIWMFISASRFVSRWLNLTPNFETPLDLSEGSPIDSSVFAVLIAAGIAILVTRKTDWRQLAALNSWIVLYYIYCLASMTWSDDSALVAKRWIKELGHPIMALVILTERRPYDAAAAILRRLAYIALPLSVLFIKYYPQFARSYKPDGTPMYTGIGTQKNDLGFTCLLVGLYLLWDALWPRIADGRRSLRTSATLAVALAGTIIWLLHVSDSKTPVVCLAVVGAILLAARARWFRSNMLLSLTSVLAGLVIVWSIDDALQIRALIFKALERNPTLTNRTEIWDIALNYAGNPVIGVGYMSFWTGGRAEDLFRDIGVGINQAHNGYIEQYLNLGYVGVAFILAIIAHALLDISRHVLIDPPAAMLRLAFISAAVASNITEAAFYGFNNAWMILLLSCIVLPRYTPTASMAGTLQRARPSPGVRLSNMGAAAQQPQPRLTTNRKPPVIRLIKRWPAEAAQPPLGAVANAAR